LVVVSVEAVTSEVEVRVVVGEEFLAKAQRSKGRPLEQSSFAPLRLCEEKLC
jgi:hypothetical protein